MNLPLIVRFVTVVATFVGSLILVMGGYVVLGLVINFLCVALLLYGTLSPNSQLFGPIQSQSEGGPLLTIDDGPDPQDTLPILDLLDRYDAKAVFFLIGEKAAKHPDLVREIARRGHEIGNHTWSHPQATFWAAGPWRTRREIVRCQNVLSEILGKAPRLFRAPVGHSNFFVHPVLRSHDLKLMGWSARGYDAVSTDVNEVLEKINGSLQEGSIVLAHDATPIALEVIEGILKLLKAHDESVVDLGS